MSAFGALSLRYMSAFGALSLRYLSADLKLGATKAKGFHMSEDPAKNMSREDRLAAKLRENLRRRKAQARALGNSDAPDATEMLHNRADQS
ncbi:MAG: hypothetical protein NWS68_00625 [Erythrobacter sp.]|nr:hypothetical protein [Erythrobacter sp.]